MNYFTIFSFSSLAISIVLILIVYLRSRRTLGKRTQITFESDKFNTTPADNENYNRLISLLDNDRVFTNPNLTVNDLSGFLELHPKKVSQLINHYAGMNFSQLVNKYRIAESKKLLSDVKYSNITMHGIAKEAGFNSRSVFNLVFKTEVGQTPSDFKKQALQ
ncbi:DNA-binding transcriptional regulator AraC [compost metagenome]